MAVALLLVSSSLKGQGAGHDLDSPAERQRRLLPFYAWAATAPCLTYDGPVRGDAESRMIQRAWIRNRVRPFGFPVEDSLELEEIRASSPQLVIKYTRIESRTTGVQVPAYIIEPAVPRPDSSAVLLLHGTRTSFEQAIGWNFDAGQARQSTSAIVGMAITLAQSGFRVLVPWVEDERLYSYTPPWGELSRLAGPLAAQRAGDGLSVLMANLEGMIDYLAASGARRIGVVGDREGAALSLILGALDERVGAVASLLPPLDRPALRADVSELIKWPPYTQSECALNDPLLASAIAPKPLLYIWNQADSEHVPLVARWGSRDIDAAIRRIYAEAGAADRLQITEAPTSIRTQWVLARWMRTALGLPPIADAVDGRVPGPSRLDRYPVDALADVRIHWSAPFVQAAQLDFLSLRPDFSSAPAYKRSVAPARSAAWRILTGEPEMPEPAARILERDTVTTNAEFTLERLVLEWPRGRMRFQAMFAMPRRTQGAVPLVFSTDETLGANELFGLPPTGTTEYLGAYGVTLARSGYAVFAPILEPEVTNVVPPLMRSRNPNTPGSWSLFLPLYRSALGTALSMPRIDTSRVAVYGISFAGYAALAIGALDDRIKTLVYSNPGNVYRQMLEDGNNNFATWIWDGHAVWDALEQYLVWPRRFIREVEDSPRYEERTLQRVDEIRSLYEKLGTGSRFRYIAQPGGHVTKVLNILPWLNGK
ncbi:MAG: hypothetical protein ACREPM_14500 [Gemmatimonadaceae bacterium]